MPIRTKHHSNLGFTLIELLVVTASIAILAGMLLPALSTVNDDCASKNSECLPLTAHNSEVSHENS